ncbi:complement C1q-like protein 2 [Etheostoma spectabile]|uniref:complement C1q-like protein 2 n=1 Tax=Etheostoma spectabile TaxID=54343 RepID=UPI0013AEFD9B|nr:complement C1q-like protein 2 [Etheostoma spectabile]
MRASGSLMLLLLLGSVSPSGSTDYQKSFPQDLYAALRETTASLVQLKEEIRSLQTKEEAAELKTTVDALKQQLQVRQVAFTASLVVSGEQTIGPFPSETLLVYKHVTTNIGNAYNPNTGLFTAPVRGAYHFEWWVGAHGDNGAHPAGAVLVRNSEKIALAYEQQSQYYGTASNGASLLLEAGDVVFVRLGANCLAFDNYNHHTTFSGHLLFPM